MCHFHRYTTYTKLKLAAPITHKFIGEVYLG